MQYYGQPTGVSYQTMGGPPPQSPVPKSKKHLILIIFAIIILILLGLSLALPWFVESFNGEPVYEYSFGGISTEDDTISWGDVPGADNTKGVYNLTMGLVILSLIFSILVLIGGILTMKGKDKRIVVIFGLLTFIGCLLAPILFMGMHPGAIKDDSTVGDVSPSGEGPWDSFFGEKDKVGWGPGAGWYCAIIAFILAIFAFILALKLPEPEPPVVYQQQPSVMPMQPMQYGYGMQPMQPMPQYYQPPPQPYFPPQPPQQQYGYPQQPPQQQYGYPQQPQQQYGYPPQY